ncbi:TetR/AcrR family transcriptional regulator [Camelimonas abortus]|uniref:TetR/AcrR family transcriptional regulator n=1 Tax=Camelimonas abortus TaxID=1017184 RepID=A0ABV7LC08_9HYPH
MARYGKGHKQEARERIIRQAAERFRRDGIAAVGVRALMADAGLTHGGFYAHFASRSELVADAVAHAAASTLDRLRQAVSEAPPGAALEALAASYLSPRHRAAMAHGCAAAALAPEIARESDAARRRFLETNDAIVALVERCLPPGGTAQARQARAAAVFCLMMGALQMARIAAAPDDVARFLDAARHGAVALGRQPWPEAAAEAPPQPPRAGG